MSVRAFHCFGPFVLYVALFLPYFWGLLNPSMEPLLKPNWICHFWWWCHWIIFQIKSKSIFAWDMGFCTWGWHVLRYVEHTNMAKFISTLKLTTTHLCPTPNKTHQQYVRTLQLICECYHTVSLFGTHKVGRQSKRRHSTDRWKTCGNHYIVCAFDCWTKAN